MGEEIWILTAVTALYIMIANAATELRNYIILWSAMWED